MPDSVVRLPSGVLVELADRCAAAGEAGIAALRETGRGLGLSIYDELVPDRSVEELDPEEFWAAVGQKFIELGLGPVRYEQVDEGLAAVCLVAFPEAGGETIGERRSPGCHFGTGLLGGLLSRAADQSIAVLEIECRADGSHGCWFLLGSQSRLEGIHEQLLAGEPIENAIKGR
ncbi:MAG: hypothetical protein JSV95_00995 [Gemmatimonadota bacterium]|jgi:predicted hydrocarbon binding protein|nr:MAG: hypothetical protein JSV95_00995 [Gemmatimonadota bacterium]